MLCINCKANEAQAGSEFCSPECKEEAFLIVTAALMDIDLAGIEELSGVMDDPEWRRLVSRLEEIKIREN